MRSLNADLQAENRKLQALGTSLHERHHTMTLRVACLQDALNSRDTENAELRNQIDETQYELMKVLFFCNYSFALDKNIIHCEFMCKSTYKL